jgi:hypothetical protein
MSVMNFNTANQTFRQLLGNGLTYRVPPFQRDYSWTDDEWDDLWQDILGLFEKDGETAHYLGYLVLQSADNKCFDIIDGQQRLTTISVMILAALSHLRDLAAAGLDSERNLRRRDNLQNSYIGYVDPVSLVPRSKLELNRHNNRFYQTYLVPLDTLPQRGLNASEQQLRTAFGWFKDKITGYIGQQLDSGEQLASFLDRLVDKLFFTVITVSDELNAFKVFETLNARGVRLSATDLLKNYLFSVINSTTAHETELKVIEERWERIVDLLGSESFSEFLRVYWNSRYTLVRQADLFKTIRRRITTREQAFDILRGLDNGAEVYAALLDPHDSQWNGEERAALQQLSLFSVRQPLVLLLACYQRFVTLDRPVFTRILRAAVIISFRCNVIAHLPTHDQERVYHAAAQAIFAGRLTTVGAILNELQGIYPDDRHFKAAFSEKEFCPSNTRNRKIVRYILFTLERQLSGQTFDFESASYDLEHILPEHPAPAWGSLDDAKHERLIYRLGNITPLESSRNRQLGNADYATKRSVYATSDFMLTRAVAEHYDVWDEAKIRARQQRLAEIASAIWRVDFGG